MKIVVQQLSLFPMLLPLPLPLPTDTRGRRDPLTSVVGRQYWARSNRERVGSSFWRVRQIGIVAYSPQPILRVCQFPGRELCQTSQTPFEWQRDWQSVHCYQLSQGKYTHSLIYIYL